MKLAWNSIWQIGWQNCSYAQGYEGCDTIEETQAVDTFDCGGPVLAVLVAIPFDYKAAHLCQMARKTARVKQ